MKTPAPVAAIRGDGPLVDPVSGGLRLLVDGDPFFVRGVELHNSSSSGEAVLREGLETAEAVNANTVLAAVAWEDVEPEEGTFDFSTVERLVLRVREQGLRLVVLWFGAWKNGASMYAPAWVKRDSKRFPRCVMEDGTLADTLTPFGPGDLDLAAFVEVIKFIEEIDRDHRTVLMVQIENEIGLLGASRDHSADASAVFAGPVRDDLRQIMAHRPGFRAEGPLTWAEVADDPTGRDEAFMAAGYSAHVERLASAAREVSSLPFFVNAWLDSEKDLELPGFDVAGGQVPGTFPSGGPLPRVADVWTTLAPTLDVFAPDFYFGDPDVVFGAFSHMGRRLFIPEMRRDEVGVGQAFLATGEYHALGTSPFGVDSGDETVLQSLTDGYAILRALDPWLGSGLAPTHGFHLRDGRGSTTLDFDDVQIEVSRSAGLLADPAGSVGYGVVVRIDAETFLFGGRGFRADFGVDDPGRRVWLESVEELSLDDEPKVLRRMNGDETAGGRAVLHPPTRKVDSPFPIPAYHRHAGLSRVRIYRLPNRDS